MRRNAADTKLGAGADDAGYDGSHNREDGFGVRIADHQDARTCTRDALPGKAGPGSPSGRLSAPRLSHGCGELMRTQLRRKVWFRTTLMALPPGVACLPHRRFT